MIASARPLLRPFAWALFALELALLSTCSPPLSKLEQIQQLGALRVATVNSPSTYYDSGDGPSGFSYDLSKRFADWLGVELDIRVTPSASDALQAVVNQKVHMAAANLTITDSRAKNILFSPAVRELRPQLVYQIGSKRKPRSLEKLNGPIHVLADSAQQELAEALRAEYESIVIEPVSDVSSEDLLVQVAQGEIPYTIADSDLVAMTSRYYHKIGVALNVGEPVRKSWAFRQHRDSSLFNQATRFLTELTASGELALINERYFGLVDKLDFVSSRSLSRHIDDRLPRYRQLFEEAGERTGIDWRLLAAIGYQESHWNPNARSTTGVEGLMMLTRDTAKYIKIKDRKDPAQSIDGGARYFRFLLDRLPDEISPPDRIWMALASYNMGYGHLLDVRRLTEKQGGNPNLWADVRANLRLLTQPKWYKQTRYGYARGHEAEAYVGHVRTYLDVLNWMTRRESEADTNELVTPRIEAPSEDRATNPLDMELPVL